MAWLYLQEYHFPLPVTRRWSARRLALVHVSGNHVSINHFSISESRLDPGEKFEERKKNPFQRILPIYEFTIEFITR